MSLSSDELNYLIWRYLCEAGYDRSLQSFQDDSGAHLFDAVFGAHIPPNELPALVQRGIQYKMLECKAKGIPFPDLSTFDAKPSKTTKTNAAKYMMDQSMNDFANGSRDPVVSGSFPADIPEPPEYVVPESDSLPDNLVPTWTSPIGPGKFVDIQWHPYLLQLALASTQSYVECSNIFARSKTEDLLKQASLFSAGTKPNNEVTAVAWHPLGVRLAMSTADGLVWVWNATTQSLEQVYNQHSSSVLALKFSPSGTYLLSVDCTHSILIVDCDTGLIRQAYQGPMQEVLSPDAEWIDSLLFVSSGTQNTVSLFKISEKKPLRILKGHTAPVTVVKYDATTETIASGSKDCSVRLWKSTSTDAAFVLEGHKAAIKALQFSKQNPQTLASASSDGSIRLWNTETGQQTAALDLHESAVLSLEFRPTGQSYLVSGGADGVLLLWDLGKFQPVARCDLSSLNMQATEPQCIVQSQWSKDGTRLVVMCLDRAYLLRIPLRPMTL
ncbi:hypothetical protein CANCADRAFT_127051 [Tortispora caseinolytica NRRL Y-17796]|uniref:IFT140 first beta-propeller domain-containing protein n=1 Tax=Tortispora caseinolytica NRRL Y-17796 TaxID=767744 RepID=A0A1E4TAA3_9ASCO|nr:hypothetical protein CANCADRAFT_127051 [Tortispora caseinolytica NRRL Y-17796]